MATIIVPVRNAGDHLQALLAALDAQTLSAEKFEIVVGDDGSSDGSTDLLPSEGRLRVVRGPEINAYAARNRAASTSHAPVIAFCDVDCRPDPRWLEMGLAAIAHADIVGGLIQWVTPARPTIWTLLDIDSFVDQERAIRAGRGLTGNLFVRRDLFEDTGGFDSSLQSHGDYEFVERCRASGARLEFARDAVVWHPTHNRAGPFIRKFLEANRSYAVRQSRVGRRPEALKFRSLVPLVQPARGRRRSGRSLSFDRRRMSESGVAPSLLQHLLGVVFIYFILPYTAALAQLSGWWQGRRLRTRPGLGR